MSMCVCVRSLTAVHSFMCPYKASLLHIDLSDTAVKEITVPLKILLGINTVFFDVQCSVYLNRYISISIAIANKYIIIVVVIVLLSKLLSFSVWMDFLAVCC